MATEEKATNAMTRLLALERLLIEKGIITPAELIKHEVRLDAKLD